MNFTGARGTGYEGNPVGAICDTTTGECTFTVTGTAQSPGNSSAPSVMQTSTNLLLYLIPAWTGFGYVGYQGAQGQGASSGGGAPSKGPPCAPSGTAPAPSVYQQRGQLANGMANSQDPYGMGSAAGAMYNLSELYPFKRGNALDAQVRYGGWPAYANYVFGVYLGAVGWTLPQTLAAANDYAASRSHYPAGTVYDPVYKATPAGNVANITAGYTAAQNGTLCHK